RREEARRHHQGTHRRRRRDAQEEGSRTARGLSSTHMTNPSPTTGAPPKDHGRAGRNLPAAITSAVLLLSVVAASLWFWKTAFMIVVCIAIVIGIWELGRALRTKGIDVPEQPLMI